MVRDGLGDQIPVFLVSRRGTSSTGVECDFSGRVNEDSGRGVCVCTDTTVGRRSGTGELHCACGSLQTSWKWVPRGPAGTGSSRWARRRLCQGSGQGDPRRTRYLPGPGLHSGTGGGSTCATLGRKKKSHPGPLLSLSGSFGVVSVLVLVQVKGRVGDKEKVLR